jgi:hypothetical protein
MAGGTMSFEHAEEVLNALGRDIISGYSLPVIALNMAHEKQSWAAKAWVPEKFRPQLPEGFGGGPYRMAELDESLDIYVGISLFGPWVDKFNRDAGVKMMKSPTYGNFMRRAKDNFVGMVAIMVDDVGDEDGTMGAGAKIMASKIAIQPSWKVCTSPHCWQYWYLLETMVSNREIAERFIDDLVASGLTTDAKDPGMKGVSRVGRLPMGANNKPKYGTPPPEVYGSAFTGERFTLTGLAKAFGLPDPFRPVERKSYNGYATISEAPKQLQVMQQFLEYLGMVKFNDGRGTMEITCPWIEKHSKKGDKPDDSGSKYFAPGVENGFKGGFYCWHGSCNGRNIRDLAQWAEEKAQKLMTQGVANVTK